MWNLPRPEVEPVSPALASEFLSIAPPEKSRETFFWSTKRYERDFPGGSVQSLVAQMVKRLPTMPETRVQSLGWEDLLEKEVATHSSILAWRIPMDRGAWLAIVHRSQRVGHD